MHNLPSVHGLCLYFETFNMKRYECLPAMSVAAALTHLRIIAYGRSNGNPAEPAAYFLRRKCGDESFFFLVLSISTRKRFEACLFCILITVPLDSLWLIYVKYRPILRYTNLLVTVDNRAYTTISINFHVIV